MPTAIEKETPERGRRQLFHGTVVSDKADKTRVVMRTYDAFWSSDDCDKAWGSVTPSCADADLATECMTSSSSPGTQCTRSSDCAAPKICSNGPRLVSTVWIRATGAIRRAWLNQPLWV